MIPNKKGTVLLLSTYPIVSSRHGGQLRVLNIKRAYECAGWNVVSVAVYADESYAKSDIGPSDVAFPSDNPHRLLNGEYIPFITDLAAGRFSVADPGAFQRILSLIPAEIDIVQVEQPWLWPLAVKLRTLSKYSSALLVYSSHNVEAPLKEAIFLSHNVKNFHQALRATEELEKQAAREADISLAVTQEEANTLQSWGAKRVLLLPNGIEPWRAKSDVVEKWRKKLPKHSWMLYVASAHPPNFSHFAEIFGNSLGCFPPTSKLVVAGSVSEHVYSVMEATKWSSLNHSRLELLFTLSEDDLAAVKTLAHGFVLPIPFGGGSNIKTAEALYSGAYVVGTPSAFRGYEKFLELPEVRIGSDARQFQLSVREILALPSASEFLVDSKGSELRQSLRWDRCLALLPIELENLRNGKVRSE
jgi:glycosyltransferase involved in cell wall biosynthesis